MRSKKKLFKQSEKVVILLFLMVACVLSVQVLFLYFDKQAEVRATSEKHYEQVAAENIDREKADKEQAKQLDVKEKAVQSKSDKSSEQNSPTKAPPNDSQNAVKKSDENDTTEKTKAQTKHEKVAYLTIDDGPSDVEDEILDLLAKYDAKATFFMLEPNIRKYPDAVKRIVEDGHAVGLHGVSHNAEKFYRSEQSVLQEMNQTQKAVEKITGVRATLIRTPFGSSPGMTPQYKQAVKNKGYQLWDWNVDSRDWKDTNRRFVQNSISQIEKLASRGEDPIILIHSKRTTLNHLSELLDYLKGQDYVLEALDETMEPHQLQ